MRGPIGVVWGLALSGMVPFVILAGLILWGGDPVLAETARRAMIAYGAAVLGFLGGVRWGAELVRAPDAPVARRMAAAAVPPTVAWGAMLVEQPKIALGLLLTSGVVQLAWDVSAARTGLLPGWTGPMRMVLTSVGTVAILVGIGA